jgi:ornithine carbamoyltransferase
MNLISSDDLSKDEINKIFRIADDLKNNKVKITIKEHAILALLFEKPSTRTRVSLEVAMAQLGGQSIYLDIKTSQMERGESLQDTTRILGSYCDFIAARLFDHAKIVAMAQNSQVPIINALTDLEHPTQALADLYTIMQHFGKIRDTKIAFLGDVTANTANSLMLTAAKLGAEISLVGPKEFQPNSIYFNKAREYSKVYSYNSLEEGLEDADIVYTDTYVSMGQEAQTEYRKKIFSPYQLNEKALSLASKTALVMHCLPAHRGEEITGEVLDGPRSIVWEQAKNKLLISKAILLYLSESGMPR